MNSWLWQRKTFLFINFFLSLNISDFSFFFSLWKTAIPPPPWESYSLFSSNPLSMFRVCSVYYFAIGKNTNDYFNARALNYCTNVVTKHYKWMKKIVFLAILVVLKYFYFVTVHTFKNLTIWHWIIQDFVYILWYYFVNESWPFTAVPA